MQKWVIKRHGGLESLELVSDNPPGLKSGNALIRPNFISLNHLDLWVRKGVDGHRFPLPLTPGCDISGVIIDGDFKNHPHLKIGQRVLVNPILSCNQCRDCLEGNQNFCSEFGLLGETQNGGLSELISIPITNLLPLSESIRDEDASCLPIAYVTAWNMLNRKTKILPHHTILIQAGGSGVSVACTQIAKMIGATVITTVRSEDKKLKSLNLGADFVINTVTETFKEEIKKIFTKLSITGADIVVDHVGADTLFQSLKSLKRGGALVSCGATSGSKIDLPMNLIFFKNLSILGSTMGSSADLHTLLSLLKNKKLNPIIDSIFDFKNLPAAHQHLESRAAFGKVLIRC